MAFLLHSWLKTNRMKIVELARYLGVSRQFVSQCMRGKRPWPEDKKVMLVKLCGPGVKLT